MNWDVISGGETRKSGIRESKKAQSSMRHMAHMGMGYQTSRITSERPCGRGFAEGESEIWRVVGNEVKLYLDWMDNGDQLYSTLELVIKTLVLI